MAGNQKPLSTVEYDGANGLKGYDPNTGAWEDVSLDHNALAVGQATLRRQEAVAVTQAMGSGTLRLTYFTATKTETIANARTITGTTAAGATPTLVRIGVYSEDSNGDLTLVASTPNDTTLYAAASTAYTKALSAPVELVKGRRYAVGILVVTGATAPTLLSGLASLNAAEAGMAPRLCGTRTALSDLVTPITAGTIGNTAVQMYAVVTP